MSPTWHSSAQCPLDIWTCRVEQHHPLYEKCRVFYRYFCRKRGPTTNVGFIPDKFSAFSFAWVVKLACVFKSFRTVLSFEP